MQKQRSESRDRDQKSEPRWIPIEKSGDNLTDNSPETVIQMFAEQLALMLWRQIVEKKARDAQSDIH